MGHVQGPKNISSKRNQMLKISDQFFLINFFDLKTLFPVSNPTHQTYSTHNPVHVLEKETVYMKNDMEIKLRK